MMLAIYLAAPNKNDRRALNALQDTQSLKKGRLMGKTPFGYINRNKGMAGNAFYVKKIRRHQYTMGF